VATIRVAVEAFLVDLYPESMNPAAPPQGAATQTLQLTPLAQGLALPSFWTSQEVRQTFDEANRIWQREADILFEPLTITERSETVPADEQGMWIYFVNHLTPRNRGVGVAFVYDLPAAEGGWGGGRIAVLSGLKAREGLPGHAGNLLAHELGHVLIDDPQHTLAGSDVSNLMHGRRNSRVANAGLLNANQVQLARTRAARL
jgi:hypothetical protein